MAPRLTGQALKDYNGYKDFLKCLRKSKLSNAEISSRVKIIRAGNLSKQDFRKTVDELFPDYSWQEQNLKLRRNAVTKQVLVERLCYFAEKFPSLLELEHVKRGPQPKSAQHVTTHTLTTDQANQANQAEQSKLTPEIDQVITQNTKHMALTPKQRAELKRFYLTKENPLPERKRALELLYPDRQWKDQVQVTPYRPRKTLEQIGAELEADFLTQGEDIYTYGVQGSSVKRVAQDVNSLERIFEVEQKLALSQRRKYETILLEHGLFESVTQQALLRLYPNHKWEAELSSRRKGPGRPKHSREDLYLSFIIGNSTNTNRIHQAKTEVAELKERLSQQRQASAQSAKPSTAQRTNSTDSASTAAQGTAPNSASTADSSSAATATGLASSSQVQEVESTTNQPSGETSSQAVELPAPKLYLPKLWTLNQIVCLPGKSDAQKTYHREQLIQRYDPVLVQQSCARYNNDIAVVDSSTFISDSNIDQVAPTPHPHHKSLIVNGFKLAAVHNLTTGCISHVKAYLGSMNDNVIFRDVAKEQQLLGYYKLCFVTDRADDSCENRASYHSMQYSYVMKASTRTNVVKTGQHNAIQAIRRNPKRYQSTAFADSFFYLEQNTAGGLGIANVPGKNLFRCKAQNQDAVQLLAEEQGITPVKGARFKDDKTNTEYEYYREAWYVVYKVKRSDKVNLVHLFRVGKNQKRSDEYLLKVERIANALTKAYKAVQAAQQAKAKKAAEDRYHNLRSTHQLLISSKVIFFDSKTDTYQADRQLIDRLDVRDVVTYYTNYIIEGLDLSTEGGALHYCEIIHRMYELRWRIEIDFRITKSGSDNTATFKRKATTIAAKLFFVLLSVLAEQLCENEVENNIASNNVIVGKRAKKILEELRSKCQLNSVVDREGKRSLELPPSASASDREKMKKFSGVDYPTPYRAGKMSATLNSMN